MDENKVLRLSTSGSVDDGKSTLIGRLLYETNSLPDDKLEAIKEGTKKKGLKDLDFSLATDGLIAEREQGITIDVAHIYFSTPNHSYIIADTPGHIEYTRNMVTGSSTSQVAVILIDARNGVIEQTKRHFFINNLLRMKQVIVAINKMDLVDYSEEVFQTIQADLQKLIEKAEYKEQTFQFIPVSALKGDNISQKSVAMPWYAGKTFLATLEHINLNKNTKNNTPRFYVQNVIRPKTDEFRDFRGYAGRVKGGNICVGDEVVVLPSKRKSIVKSIELYTKKYKAAEDGSSMTITLKDDINVTRGDVLVKATQVPTASKNFLSRICWMDHEPLVPGKMYLLQKGIKRVKAKIKSIESKMDITSLKENTAINKLELNDIGDVHIQVAKELFYDTYNKSKENGAGILIDPKSNTTAGVVFFK